MKKKPKPKKLVAYGWAGIVDNKLDMGWIEGVKYKDKLLGIFATRREAKLRYEGVKKVKITEI